MLRREWKARAIGAAMAALTWVGSAAAALDVPLSVTDYAGMRRTDEPVTSGVPLPEGAGITSTDQLRLVDAGGKPVPAQFSVLSRWRGTPGETAKPIKWVLADFQAEVPADGTSTYALRDAGPTVTAAAAVRIDETAEAVVVDTGKARFRVSKTQFRLFEEASLDADGDGTPERTVLSSRPGAGITLVDGAGKPFFSSLEAPEQVVVEESGPLRAVLRVRGVFKAEDGTYFAPSVCLSAAYPKFCQPYPKSYVYWECRVHFYAGKDFARVFLTLENNGANGRTNPEPYYAPNQAVTFDSLELVLQPRESAARAVTTAGYGGSLAAAESFSVYQGWRENLADGVPDTLEPVFDNGIYYELSKGGQSVGSGPTHPGWLEASSEGSGLGVALRQFWQNFPKKLTVGPDGLRVSLWPSEGYYPYTADARSAGTYLLEGGTHKTTEMVIALYPGAGAGRTEFLSKVLENPLLALAPPDWYASTGALGMISPPLESSEPELDEALHRYERLQGSLVYAGESENGYTIDNLKTGNPPHWEWPRQNRFFGWMNFGDLDWSSHSPSSLHYDWTYSMLLHFLRTGKRRFFEAGAGMATHRYDVDQYHGERTSTGGHHKWINHMQFYESTGHGDPNQNSYYPSRVSLATHTWNGGLALYYLLTGDRRAWEAADENAQGMVNNFGPLGVKDARSPVCPDQEIRSEGWAILTLLNAYRVGGSPVYLETARNVARNRLLYREQQVGGEGHWGVDRTASAVSSLQKSLPGFSPVEAGCRAVSNVEATLMFAYVIEPLVTVADELRDPDLDALVVRMADFAKDHLLYGGETNAGGKYLPLQTQAVWTPGDPDGSLRKLRGEPIKAAMYANLFSYAFHLTQDPTYLVWARKTFRDSVFYYAATGSIAIDPAARSKASFVDGMFPNSHTKVHGWLGRFNQVYLYTEWKLQQGSTKVLTTALPRGTAGSPYRFPLSVVGGTQPYVFRLAGQVPAGVQLTADGILGGTPTAGGAFPFDVVVTDAAGVADTRHLVLEVAAGPAPPGRPSAPSGLRVVE